MGFFLRWNFFLVGGIFFSEIEGWDFCFSGNFFHRWDFCFSGVVKFFSEIEGWNFATSFLKIYTFHYLKILCTDSIKKI